MKESVRQLGYQYMSSLRCVEQIYRLKSFIKGIVDGLVSTIPGVRS